MPAVATKIQAVNAAKAKVAPGPVAADEMYAFVPALALGGENDVEHLKRVKMREQVLLLSQVHEQSRRS